MDYISLREKHGETILNLTATEIVLAGLKTALANKDKSVLAESIAKCAEDINSGTWDEVRGAIKRSL